MRKDGPSTAAQDRGHVAALGPQDAVPHRKDAVVDPVKAASGDPAAQPASAEAELGDLPG